MVLNIKSATIVTIAPNNRRKKMSEWEIIVSDVTTRILLVTLCLTIVGLYVFVIHSLISEYKDWRQRKIEFHL